jgi:CheY-like chemotaxis protein
LTVSTLTLSRSALAGTRVLVVDDNPDMLSLWRAMFGVHGADVSAVTSAHAALSLLSREPFDVLVSDISMPGESGYELIRKVRSLDPKRGGAMPALAVTAFSKVYDAAQSLNAGFQAHLPKDAEPDEIVGIVARLAGR